MVEPDDFSAWQGLLKLLQDVNSPDKASLQLRLLSLCRRLHHNFRFSKATQKRLMAKEVSLSYDQLAGASRAGPQVADCLNAFLVLLEVQGPRGVWQYRPVTHM
jgi:hypothetical protein